MGLFNDGTGRGKDKYGEKGSYDYQMGTGSTVYGNTNNTNQAGPANPWLSSAYQNTSNPNQDYQSYLEGLGMDIDPSKVGQFFGGIAEDYQQDVGMARAGLDQTMGQGRMMGQQAMFGLGGGSGISSGLGGGFGRQGYGMMQGIGGVNKQYGQTLSSGLLGYTGDLQSAQRGMESSFRDVATGLLGRDSAGISWDGTAPQTPDWAVVPTDDPSWNPPQNPTHGSSYNMNGESYYWNQDSNSWETEQDFNRQDQDRDDGQDYYSDVRLKKDINYLFTMNNGVPIYNFKYKWSDDVSIGTMAQDIEDMIPEAISHDSNGYKMVNYSKVFNYGTV